MKKSLFSLCYSRTHMNTPFYTAICVLLSVSACTLPKLPKHTTSLSISEIRSMDYGNYPKDYKQRIDQRLRDTLFDYDSAKIKIIMPPKKVFLMHDAPVDPFNPLGQKEERRYTFYMVCVNVNAKNQYGGYTGWQTYAYNFEKNKPEIQVLPDALGCQDAINSEYSDIYISIPEYTTLTP